MVRPSPTTTERRRISRRRRRRTTRRSRSIKRCTGRSRPAHSSCRSSSFACFGSRTNRRQANGSKRFRRILPRTSPTPAASLRWSRLTTRIRSATSHKPTRLSTQTMDRRPSAIASICELERMSHDCNSTRHGILNSRPSSSSPKRRLIVLRPVGVTERFNSPTRLPSTPAQLQ